MISKTPGAVICTSGLKWLVARHRSRAEEHRNRSDLPVFFRRRATHDDVQGGHGRQVEIKIEVIAAADEDGRGFFHFGSSRVVRGQVNRVKRRIYGSGSIGRAGLTNRWRVHRIPRLGDDGDEVGAGIEGREFERSLVVGLIGSRGYGATDAGTVVIAPERDAGVAHRFAEFVEDVAGEHGRGDEAQS